MDVSAAQILAGIGQFLLVAVVAFGAYCLLISHLRFEALTERATAGDLPASASAEGAQAVVAARIAGSNRPMVLMVFDIRSPANEPLEESQVSGAVNALRANVRSGDRAVRIDHTRILAMLEAEGQHAETIRARLSDALKNETTPARTVTCGYALYPAEGGRAADLIALASGRISSGERPPATAVYPEGPVRAEQKTAASKIIDPLTEVLRADLLYGSIHKYLARSRDADLPFSVLYLDVDFMRRYNEQYDLYRGDIVLRGLSTYLQRHVREEDLIGRGPGGDEFAIGLAVNGERALEIAQRIGLALRRADRDSLIDGLRVSVSIGVATWPAHGTHGRQVLDAARHAMKLAKQRGRGQAVLAEGPAPEEETGTGPSDRL